MRWAHLGSNQGPRSYQERALPLSHAPESYSAEPNFSSRLYFTKIPIQTQEMIITISI